MFKKLSTYFLLTLSVLMGLFVDVRGSLMSYSPVINETYAGDCTNGAYPDAMGNCPGATGFDSSTAGGGAIAVKNTESEDMKKMLNSLVAGLNIALSVVTILVSPAVMFAGWLLSPDWTSGDLFGLRSVMYQLWVTISNITYFIYAVLLIVIALATIFGRDNFGYKAMLPKLALGILMVPFTWWFVQWTISLASIVTASVITIPDTVLSNVSKTSGTWWTQETIPRTIVVDNNSGDISTSVQNNIEKCPTNCMKPEELLRKSTGVYGHMLIYAYGVFKLGEVDKIKTGLDAAKSIVKLVHDGFIAVIMLIVFGLLTLALIFMLMARAVMLWVYTIFSPFLTLEIVMGGVLKKVSGDFSLKEFIGLAFVPTLVGLALSFGLVVVAAVQSPIKAGDSKDCTIDMLTKEGSQGCKIVGLMGNDNNTIMRRLEPVDGQAGKYTTINEITIGGMKFIFRGSIGGASSPGDEANSVNTSTSVISSTGGIFGTIVVDIIALLFIWMAFMAAKGVSKVVDVAAKPFEDMGKKIGSLGASLPKYTPIPGLGISAAGMNKVADNASNYVQARHEEEFKSSAAGKWFGGKEAVSSIDEKGIKERLDKISSVNDIGYKQIGEILSRQGGKNTEYSTMYKDISEKLKGYTNPYDKKIALRTMGFDESNADIIVDRLKEHGGNFEKSDSKLVQAFKSVSNNSTTGGSGTNSIYSAKQILGEANKNKIEVDIEGIRINIDADGKNISTISKEGMQTLKNKLDGLTEAEFKNRLSGVTDGVRSAIIESISKNGTDGVRVTFKNQTK